MIRLFAPVSLLVLAFLAMLPAQNGRVMRGENDFVQFYLGGQYVGTEHLLDPEFLARRQQEVLGISIPSVTFVRLPAFAYPFWPLAKLPYRAAYWTFLAMSFAALLASLWVVRFWAPDAGWWVGISLPLLVALINGQDVILIMAALIMAARRFEQGEEFEAGLWLALCLVKFHFFLLFPLVLILHRVWKMVAGATVGAAIVWGLSFLAGGADWMPRYWQVITRPEIHPNPLMMQTLDSLAGGAGVVAWVLRGVVVVAVALIAWKSPSWRLAWAAALLGGRLLPPHAYVHDLVFVLAAYLIAAPDLPVVSRRTLQFVLLPVLPYCAFLSDPWPRVLPGVILLILLMIMVEIVWRPAAPEPTVEDGVLPLPQGA